jgi:GT2 family glycosyltransferase
LNRVAVVIVNRNTRELLRECLMSVARQRFGGGISVWVVDNGSTDGSAEMVLRDFPEVDMVWNTGNVGYAKACNAGILVSGEPYIVVCNSDTILATDTVSEIVDFFDGTPAAGAVGPLILNTDGSLQYSCREFPSVTQAGAHAFLGLFSADNRYTASYKKLEWDHATECEVDWVSGAFMALRREAVGPIGGFDEKYFMYVEDVDLCWRLHETGWTVNYMPRGGVVHHIGQSSRFATTRMTLHHHLSMLRFHRKTYRGPARWLVNPVVALGIAARFALIAALNSFYRLRARLGGEGHHIMPGRQ